MHMLGNNKKKQPKRLVAQLLRKFRKHGAERGVPAIGMGDDGEQDSVVFTIYRTPHCGLRQPIILWSTSVL
jgi:hypothetical protein